MSISITSRVGRGHVSRLLLCATMMVAPASVANAQGLGSALGDLLKPPEAVIDGMTFRIEGASGVSIERTNYAGPMFTLSQTTVITEIGGFVNHFSGTNAMRVIVVKAVNGIPDPSRVYGVFTLSGKPDFYTFTYESAATLLVLKPGSYFALFATQGDDRAAVLSVSGTFVGSVFNTGAIDSTGATAPHAVLQYLAVKIRGKQIS